MPDIERYSLRPMKSTDREMVRAWRNLEPVRRYMFNIDIVSEDAHREWFEHVLTRDDVDYRIVQLDGRPIGLANAVCIDSAARSCYWGFYIAEADAPRGSGTCLATRMLDHIFGHLPVDTVHAEVIEYNTASIGLHEKIGFRRVSVRDRVLERGNEKLDVFAYRLDRQDWAGQGRAGS